ncbi:MAG: 23S rRNA (pseudouridine(1915)-N(3))-methyltransferase RlmH [Candidatus Peribacteria bacterium]|nr:23S rRNA (pseudouridine(1915)-N(3))-methyltransferase RlmH [Candidatus Peribacteria bacterium]
MDFKFSLSKMTFPHAQAIMVLLEQLYRIFMIKKCSGYHH